MSKSRLEQTSLIYEMKDVMKWDGRRFGLEPSLFFVAFCCTAPFFCGDKIEVQTFGTVEWTVEISGSHKVDTPWVPEPRWPRPYSLRTKHQALHNSDTTPKTIVLV